MIKKLLALFVFSAFVSTAQADLLLEPYLGFNTGKWKQGSSSDSLSGVNFGARVGYKHTLGLMLGADYFTGKWEADKTDITPSTLGVFVGYEFPVLLRIYGTYGLISNEAKFSAKSASAKYEGGSNIKLGVGFTALPLVSINFEYMMATYDEAGGKSLTNDMEIKTYGVSVSLPLVF